jgi:hypothetical protein
VATLQIELKGPQFGARNNDLMFPVDTLTLVCVFSVAGFDFTRSSPQSLCFPTEDATRQCAASVAVTKRKRITTY